MTSRVADYVLRELDPDDHWHGTGFAERFRGASPALQTAIRHLWHEGRASEGLTYAERDLWGHVWSSLSLTREGYDYTAEARDTLRALRTLRDYDRMDRAMTAAACELSRLRRRLIELCARPDEPVPGLEEVRGG